MEWRAESRGSKLVEKGDAADTVSRARLPGHQRADEPGRVALTLVQDHWLRRLRFHMPSFGSLSARSHDTVLIGRRYYGRTWCLLETDRSYGRGEDRTLDTLLHSQAG